MFKLTQLITQILLATIIVLYKIYLQDLSHKKRNIGESFHHKELTFTKDLKHLSSKK